jgi:hypothetical protein
MDSQLNPYQPPPFDPKQFQDQAAYVGSSTSDYGWVSQVRVFSVLNAVQGVLEIPMGLMTSGVGALFPALIQMAEAENRNAGQPPPPTEFFWLMAAFYLAIGIPVLISGVVRIIAAIRNYRFRGRTLGMVSIILGLSTMLSCNCAPTAVGLLVYGLILFMNPAVKVAFQMVEQGHSVDQVLAAFNPHQQTYYQPPLAPPAGGENPFA